MLACVHAWTLSTYIYTTGLMITLRADRKVSTSLTAYVTYLPDSKQKSTEARSMYSLFYPFIDFSVLNWPVYTLTRHFISYTLLVPPELSLILHGIDSTK